MKRMGVIFIITFLLVGCSSNEEQIIEYVENEIKEEYGIEAKVVNIESDSGYGSGLIYFLSAIVGAEWYDLTFEAVGDPQLIFEGSIQGKDLKHFSESYVSAKHESLLQNNEQYQELNRILGQNGFSDIALSSTFTINKATNILFEGYYNGGEVYIDKLLQTIHQMVEMIVPEAPFELSLQFNIEAQKYWNDVFSNEMIEYRITSYSLKKPDDMASVLSKQLQDFHSNQAMTEGLVSQLESLNVRPSSELNGMYDGDQRWFEHRLWLDVLEPYNEKSLLSAIELLREAGMGESSLRLVFQGGAVEGCQVKDIYDGADVERCYRQ